MKNQKLEIFTFDELEAEGKIENGVIKIFLDPIYQEFKKIKITIEGEN